MNPLDKDFDYKRAFFHMKAERFYWMSRCELAEKFISETPCDPDITEEQSAAYWSWQEFKDAKPDNQPNQ